MHLNWRFCVSQGDDSSRSEGGLPKYFFHLRDHVERLPDPQGRSIDDPATIGAIALTEARALISQDALGGSIDLRQRLEVEDASGKIVHSLRFSDAVQILGLER